MSAPYRRERRAFLRLAVLVPAAAVGCATASGRRDEHAAAPKPAAPPPPAADEGPSAAETLRAVPLAMDVEPAFVFRAGRGESR